MSWENQRSSIEKVTFPWGLEACIGVFQEKVVEKVEEILAKGGSMYAEWPDYYDL